jgi:hypothetical protein
MVDSLPVPRVVTRRNPRQQRGEQKSAKGKLDQGSALMDTNWLVCEGTVGPSALKGSLKKYLTHYIF